MTKAYKFYYGGTIPSFPDSIPTYHILGCADNVQGEYVPLAEYEALRAILQQWSEIGPDLEDQPFNDGVNVTPKLQRLVSDTKAALGE